MLIIQNCWNNNHWKSHVLHSSDIDLAKASALLCGRGHTSKSQLKVLHDGHLLLHTAVQLKTSSYNRLPSYQRQSLASYTDFYSRLSAEPLKCDMTIYLYKIMIFCTTRLTRRSDYPLPECNDQIVMCCFGMMSSYNQLI